MSVSRAGSLHVNVPPPVQYLDANEAFLSLSPSEKDYVYSCSQSSWIGGLICLVQTSPESAGIFLLIQRLFVVDNIEKFIENALSHNFSADQVDAVVSYFATVLGNLGNYLSFGDNKFIPSIDLNTFTSILSSSSAFEDPKTGLKSLWNEISASVYSLDPRRLRLGFGPTGLTTYYSSNFERKDAEMIQEYLNSVKKEAYNTRVFKTLDQSRTVYDVRFASAKTETVENVPFTGLFTGSVLNVSYGDLSELMQLLCESCDYTKERALNPTEARMWELHEESFRSGSVELHKEASRFWVKDKNPPVESYIGFIETYRDPFGVRAEFEGFVAIVNKAMSIKFQRLVANAVEIISHLPWPPAYEKDKFLEPDFTSLDVVSFATSGMPVGINIPNYDDVRQVDGFKNVSLGNVLAARFKDMKTDYLRPEDKDLYLKNAYASFELQVGLHELLGHGSGKLFQQTSDGKFNFDRKTTTDLVTNGEVTSWYAPGETWDSKFSSISSPMEECRAECVGIYLCSHPLVLSLFELDAVSSDSVVSDVVYINWLSMVRSGVMSMEYYVPPDNAGDNGSWYQAHCWARYVIMRVLLEVDDTLLRIDKVTGEDGAPDLVISLDRQKILSVARPAIGRFLSNLQYYKSTANVKDGGAFFAQYSQLSPEHLKLRKIVIDRKKPRPIIVQPVLCKSPEGIQLKSYPPTYNGMIESFIERFQEYPLGPKALTALETVWRKEKPYFDDITA